MVNILIQIPESGIDDGWTIVELQGSLETSDHQDNQYHLDNHRHSNLNTMSLLQEKHIGDLHFTKTGQAILIVGHHILFGEKQNLEKPFAVIIKATDHQQQQKLKITNKEYIESIENTEINKFQCSNKKNNLKFLESDDISLKLKKNSSPASDEKKLKDLEKIMNFDESSEMRSLNVEAMDVDGIICDKSEDGIIFEEDRSEFLVNSNPNNSAEKKIDSSTKENEQANVSGSKKSVKNIFDDIENKCLDEMTSIGAGEKTGNINSYFVTAIVKKKIVFKQRPKPIVGNIAKKV